MRGWKYSLIAPASIWREPVSFSIVSCQGADAPCASIARKRWPASGLPKLEHSYSGAVLPAAAHSALWNWNCRMNDRK